MTYVQAVFSPAMKYKDYNPGVNLAKIKAMSASC